MEDEERNEERTLAPLVLLPARVLSLALRVASRLASRSGNIVLFSMQDNRI